MERRVVITGTGIVSSVGNSTDLLWDALINGKSGIGPVTRFDAEGFRTRIAGEVKDFDVLKYLPPKEARRLDHFCHFAIAACDEALEHAGLNNTLDGVNSEKVGVIVGSGIGGMDTIEKQANILFERGPSKTSPLMIPMLIVDMASGALSMRYGAKGPNFGIVSACATACHSIGESFWIVKRGDADIMITGGAEATVTKLGMTGFCAMKAMSQRNDEPLKASRPFDADRDGFVMSEGAGVLILEEYEHAKERGANILAEIVGYGTTGDAYHITSPAPGGEGAARAIKQAMNHANIKPEQIGYINAHGTSTALNDKFETAAIKSALGDHAYNVAISSTKSMTGHALGAAGGIETIACTKVLQTGIIPPTINYENPDPDCDLNYTPNKSIERDVEYAMNINLGFGGHNGVIILKKV
jgi:3-oxoacyl-[acyl-carrier-protein] synthase II